MKKLPFIDGKRNVRNDLSYSLSSEENRLYLHQPLLNVKILWLAHRDPMNPNAGGAERTIIEVCTRLARNGHNIVLLTGGWKGCKSMEWLHGIKIYRYGKNIGPHIALPILLLKYNFDLVVNDLGHAVPWFSSTILNKNNIVFFRHLHARSLPGQVNPIFSRFIMAIEKCYFILYHEAVFITESTTSRDDLLKLGIKEDKIVINPPGVDHNLFHPVAKSKYPSIVYFGGMRKYKRPREILYLVRNLTIKLKNLKLFVIGTGPEENIMKRMAKDFAVQNYVEFKGRVSKEELSDLVAFSWLNVHTSITEGWGYSILEASASGTPTIAYDVPGVRDAIEDGLNGIKVNDGNRQELYDAAFSMLREHEKWQLSSTKVAKKYSWDKTTELWEDLIKQISNNRCKK